LKKNQLTYTKLSRGSAWLDTGNPKSLNDASNFVRVIEERTGLKIACLEEISWKNNWISDSQFEGLISKQGSGEYAEYLVKVLNSDR
jgi:glucose-1-phosphate thymidylyltransferase